MHSHGQYEMANAWALAEGERERWRGEWVRSGRRRAGFVFSGISIQGTPSGPREVSPEQIRGVS